MDSEPTGQLVFVRVKHEYVARIEPIVEDANHPPMVIATLNVRLAGDEAGFLKWRDEIAEMWRHSVALCFGLDPDDVGMICIDQREQLN